MGLETNYDSRRETVVLSVLIWHCTMWHNVVDFHFAAEITRNNCKPWIIDHHLVISNAKKKIHHNSIVAVDFLQGGNSWALRERSVALCEKLEWLARVSFSFSVIENRTASAFICWSIDFRRWEVFHMSVAQKWASRLIFSYHCRKINDLKNWGDWSVRNALGTISHRLILAKLEIPPFNFN